MLIIKKGWILYIRVKPVFFIGKSTMQALSRLYIFKILLSDLAKLVYLGQVLPNEGYPQHG